MVPAKKGRGGEAVLLRLGTGVGGSCQGIYKASDREDTAENLVHSMESLFEYSNKRW